MQIKPVWTFRSLPELQHIPKADRALVLSCYATSGTLVGFWLSSFVVALYGLFFIPIYKLFGLALLPGFIVSMAFLVVEMMIFFQLLMFTVRVFIRLAIMNESKGKKLPACLKCGYDLTGCTSRKCPECGAAIIVR